MKLSFVTLSIIVFAISQANMAFAGTPVLGFEVATTTKAEFLTSMQGKTDVQELGLNKFSHGQMYSTNGDSYQIDGLQSVLYIFDTKKVLSGVVMTMDKNSFDKVYRAISAKYKVIKQDRPFVGNQYAKFKSKDSTIEISAPHLSLEMNVSYLTFAFENSFKKISEAEQKAKKHQEASQF